jgi:TonB family protein
MKICPQCGGSYTDDLSFCLQDGTPLSAPATFDATGRPTEILPPQVDFSNDATIIDAPRITAQPLASQAKQYQFSAVEPSTRMGCALTIGQVAIGLLVVVGLGFVGLFFALRSLNEVAMQSPLTSNKAANAGSPMNSGTNTASNSANIPVSTTPPSPVPMATGGRPKTISGGVLNGKAVDLPKPPYPPAARAVRATGAVTVQVTIDENGTVISASAVSGHPLLRAAAEAAARNAKFGPTLLSGKPVRVTGTIVYNFEP